MAATKIVDVTSKMVALLEPLESEVRARAIQAALVLLNEAPLAMSSSQGGSPQGSKPATGSTGAGSAKEFFANKSPESKIEELAVAARYREEVAGATESTKEDLAAVFRDARRNFDAKNFARDISNAKVKGLFSKGNGQNLVLSHHGQVYVDTLPDREALKHIRTPRKAGGKRPGAKKKAAKN